MLLGAIVQVIYWITGIIAHHQNFQSYFQSNTVKDRKIFSYFYLGRLMFEFDKVKDLKINPENVMDIIQIELARVW